MYTLLHVYAHKILQRSMNALQAWDVAAFLARKHCTKCMRGLEIGLVCKYVLL